MLKQNGLTYLCNPRPLTQNHLVLPNWRNTKGKLPKAYLVAPLMDLGLPLRKFKRLRESGEEKAKRMSQPHCCKLFPQLLWPNCVFSFLWVRAGFLNLSTVDMWAGCASGGLFNIVCLKDMVIGCQVGHRVLLHCP